MSGGRKLQLLKLPENSDRPVVQELLLEGKTAESYVLPNYYYSYAINNNLNVNSTEANKSVEIANGLYGVVQLKLAQ